MRQSKKGIKSLVRYADLASDEAEMWHGIAAKAQLELTIMRRNWWVRIGYKIGIVKDIYVEAIH